MKNSIDFVKCGPLKYDVVRYDRKTRQKYIAIPAGAEGVAIQFRAQQWTYVNDDGDVCRGNKYLWKGRVY